MDTARRLAHSPALLLAASALVLAGIAGPASAAPAATDEPDLRTISTATAGWGTNVAAAEEAALGALSGSKIRVPANAPESLRSLLSEARDRAELIRDSIASEGFTIEDPEVSASSRVAMSGSKTVLEMVTIREWTEVDPDTEERTDVSDSDVYQVAAPSVAALKSVSPIDSVAVSVSSFADDTETADDPEVATAPTSTSRPTTSSTSKSAAAAGSADAVALAAGSSNFDPDKFAAYGIKWTGSPYNGDKKSDFNPNYPYFSQNCANFVSQMFNVAGWKRTGGVNPNDEGNWDDNLTGPAGASDTWAGAAALYRYGYNKKKLAALGNIWNAVPGNTYFMDWDGNSKINHVAAVTGRTSGGIPRISQKTVNRHNLLLTTWKAKVDADSPKVKWFGLRRTTR